MAQVTVMDVSVGDLPIASSACPDRCFGRGRRLDSNRRRAAHYRPSWRIRLECLCRTSGSPGGRSSRSLHDLRQVLRSLPDGARDRPGCRRRQGARRRASGPDARRGAGRGLAEVARRLRRQRALQRRLPRGHQRPPVGDHRQDEGARGRRARARSAPPTPPTASATWRRRCGCSPACSCRRRR